MKFIKENWYIFPVVIVMLVLIVLGSIQQDEMMTECLKTGNSKYACMKDIQEINKPDVILLNQGFVK